MLDKQKALDVFHISEAEFDEFLREFVAQAEERMQDLSVALQSGDTVAAGRIAHSLKGVCGNLRLDTCFSIAKNIDAALRENRPEVMDGFIAELKAAVDEVRNSIKG